jgi:uncharacterized cupin superfamily protein
MAVTKLAADAVAHAAWEKLAELPPFAAFLDDTDMLYAHLAGPVAAPGEIAAMRIAAGGFAYTDLPAAESGFLLEGEAAIREGDEITELIAGEGYLLHNGFTGTFEVKQPVIKVFYVLP